MVRMAAALFAVTLSALWTVSSCDHTVDVPIGAIFDGVQSDEEKAAFTYAVEQINADKKILPQARLIPRMETVDNGDGLLVVEKGCSLMAQGVAAILSSTSCSSNLMLQSVCDVMHVPHIFVSRDTCDVTPDTKYTLSMNPAAFEIDKALSDIIRQQRWRTMVVLYDDELAFSRAEALLLLTRGLVPEIVLLRLPSLSNGSNTRVTLPSITEDPRNLFKHAVLLSTVENSISVINEANQRGFFTPEHHWIIANEAISDHKIKAMNMSKGQLTVARRRIPETGYASDFLKYWNSLPTNLTNDTADSVYDIKMTALYMHDAVLHLAQAVYALFRNRQWIGPNKLRCSLDVSLPWPGGALLMKEFKKQSDDGGVLGNSIFEEAKLHSSLSSKLKTLAKDGTGKLIDPTWDSWWHADIISEENFFEEMKRKSGIKGRTFRVVTLQEEPFVFKKNEGVYTGFCIDLLKELSAMLDFEYLIYEGHDGRYGSLQEDGTWDGLMKDVIEDEADFALGAIPVTPDRERTLDFTRQFMETSIGLLIRQRAKKADWLTIVKPFHLKVWLCTIAGFAVVSVALFLLHRTGSSEDGENVVRSTDDPNLADTIWFVYGTSVRQGGGISLRRLSTRILTGVWWLFILIVLSSYTANLAAYLTVTRLQTPITSVEELLSFGSYTFSALQRSSAVHFLSGSDEPSHQHIWSLLVSRNNSLVNDTTEEVERVKEGSQALVGDVPIMKHLADRDPSCQLSVIDFTTRSYGYSLAFQNGSQFTEVFSLAILKLQDSGRMDELRQRWWPGRSSNCPLHGSLLNSETTQLDLETFAAVFCILIFGLVLACTTSLFEALCRRSRQRAEMSKGKEAELNGDLQMGKISSNTKVSPGVSVHREDNGEIHIHVSPPERFPPPPPTPFHLARTYCECCGDTKKNKDSPARRKYCFCSSLNQEEGVWTTGSTATSVDTATDTVQNPVDFTTKL
ncbi:glutamate receptor ionotropic, delta-2-like [Branchiostoma floridae]|uniref:Glutamate receptor ionotropic, delta-2-like n=1 Tax=Branchiostoma floridae TaxID=7739 RepID=A0A9J7ML29_BRAFL|nr:glutamate receptor ionotropic, delta-2-like [Branchiostoma floridae]